MRPISSSLRLLLIGAVPLLVACSGGPKAVSLPPQTLTDERLPQEEPLPAPTSEEEKRLLAESEPDFVDSEELNRDPARNSSPNEISPSDEPPPELTDRDSDADTERSRARTIVIVENTDDSEISSQKLVQASRAEQARRETAPPPVAVITNDNLSQSAEGGQLVVAEVVPERPQTPIPLSADEHYWRDGARERRLAWRDAVEEVGRLEAEVAGLRRSFYAEDDPFYRDSELKPAWDRSLENLAMAREDVLTREAELAAFLETGRLAGALPGWLREGLDLEPEQATLASERRRAGDEREPRVVDEDAWEDEP